MRSSTTPPSFSSSGLSKVLILNLILILILIFWSLQGLWVFVTLLPTLALHSSTLNPAFGLKDFIGFGIWGVGFALEVIADKQKSDFKADPSNEGKFIKEGLWGVSRHPNYLGEITLWSGLWLSCSSALTGVQHLVVFSPLLVALLITKYVFKTKALHRYNV